MIKPEVCHPGWKLRVSGIIQDNLVNTEDAPEFTCCHPVSSGAGQEKMPTYVSGSVKEGDTLINKLGSRKQASPISKLLGKDAGYFMVKGTNRRKGMFLRKDVF